MSTPDWKLERMLLGEIPADENERARLDQLARDNEAILAAHPPALVRAEVERRSQAELQKPKYAFRIAMPALAIAAALAFFVLSPPPETETERSKSGAPYLLIHRRAGDHADRLASGSQVHAGDVLQVSYVSLGRPYGVIFSIDGAGVITLHHPISEHEPPKLAAEDHAIPLPIAYELDDAPKYERFFFVTSSNTLDVETVVGKARAASPGRAGELDLGRGLEVSSVLLEKGTL